jgi:hypothetical protein
LSCNGLIVNIAIVNASIAFNLLSVNLHDAFSLPLCHNSHAQEQLFVVQHELTAGPAAGFAEPYILFQMPIEGWLPTSLTVLRLRLPVECLLSECFIVARPVTRVRKRCVRYVDLSHSGLGFRLRFRSAGEEVGMKAFH